MKLNNSGAWVLSGLKFTVILLCAEQPRSQTRSRDGSELSSPLEKSVILLTDFSNPMLREYSQ